MTQPPPLLLLIDGNNLAHFLYTNLAPGQKLTPADSQLLIDHLSAYARTYPDELEVELCLDRSPGAWGPLPENLRIFPAEYPQTGDDLLLGRLWFHHIVKRPCVVVTNDEAVLEEVDETSAMSLRVYDFVRRPGQHAPVFRAPDELPRNPAPGALERSRPPHAQTLSASIYFRIIAEDSGQPEMPHREPDLPQPKAEPLPTPPQAAERAVPAGDALEISLPILNNELGREVEVSDQTAEDGEGPFYFLNLDQWPVEEGIRFLLNAFCPAHQEKYRDLMNSFSMESLRPADLRALAELLLHACGDEPDFARHGALMARVRLALLQARGEPLSLQELAARTGFKTAGLRGRIRHKAHPWVIIA